MKRLSALMLALTMVLSSVVFSAASDLPFTDVKESDYYYDAVDWAFNTTPQVTDGTSATTFSPNRTCTRGQVVTFLWRAAGEPEPSSTENPFTDVKESDYFFKPVLWAVEKGITDGTSPTTFSPKNTCRNSHILTFIYRAVGEPNKTGADIWWQDAYNWADSAGLLTGTYSGSYDINSDCPRANVVEYLYRYASPTESGAPEEKPETPKDPEVPEAPKDPELPKEPEVPETARPLEIILQSTGGKIDWNTRRLALAVVVDGGAAPYTYQWSAGSDQIPDSDSNILHVTTAGNFRCAVTDAKGDTVTSAQIPVELSDIQPLIVAEHPRDTAYINGTMENFPCELSAKGGLGREPYYYQWYIVPYDYTKIDSKTVSLVDKALLYDSALKLDPAWGSTAVEPVLNVKAINIPSDQYYSYTTEVINRGPGDPETIPGESWYNRRDAGYYCVITDSEGSSVTTDTAIVEWWTEFHAEKPKMIVDREVGEFRGSKLTRRVSTKIFMDIDYKEKTFKYQWYKDGSPLSEGAGENKIWESYVSVPLSDPGTYWVVINDDPSMKSDDFVYFITGQPEDSIFDPGQKTELSVSVGAPGAAPFTYQWQRTDISNHIDVLSVKKSPLGDYYIWDKTEDMISGKTRWDDVKGGDGDVLSTGTKGVYRCKITDANGNVNYSDPVFVSEKLHVTGHPDYQPQTGDMSVSWEGGLGAYRVSVQKYAGAWSDYTTLCGYYAGEGMPAHIGPQLDYNINTNVAVVDMNNSYWKSEKGVYRMVVRDLFTGEVVYSDSTEVK
ncbi:MAG: S-layer homology domain-containing protein [Firmicutes bacterium]|nr:S-layer homology domain-containing protein [Bacillota bacterium]